MPPPESVEVLQAAYEAFNRGDLEAATRVLHPDFEFIRLRGLPPVNGPDAMRAWMEPDAFEDMRFEPLDYRVNGDKVLVRQHVTGTGAGSGMKLDVTTFAVVTLENGLVTRMEAFLPHEETEALEAAGLSDSA